MISKKIESKSGIIDYPRLVIDDENNILLEVKENKGVLVYSNTRKLGEIADISGWPTVPYIGSVILSND